MISPTFSRYLVLIAVSFSIVACANMGAEDHAKTSRMISISLDGGQSMPPVKTAASGSSKLMVDTVSGVVSGSIELEGMDATKAHIHKGYTGKNGGVAVTLVRDEYSAKRFVIAEQIALSQDDLKLLLADGMYLQVHSAAYPKGEIRGQISP